VRKASVVEQWGGVEVVDRQVDDGGDVDVLLGSQEQHVSLQTILCEDFSHPQLRGLLLGQETHENQRLWRILGCACSLITGPRLNFCECTKTVTNASLLASIQ
jgi:hypothetical protein